MIKLWLDDVRPAPGGWTHALTALDAQRLLARVQVSEASLDHDLGHCEACTGCSGYKSTCGCKCHMTGYSVALFMAATGCWPVEKPRCHSNNPAGRANIEGVINSYFGRQIEAIAGDFRLTWREQSLAEAFVARHDLKHGQSRTAIGGRFTYKFTPTGLGTITCIVCSSCHKAKTLTDYEMW